MKEYTITRVSGTPDWDTVPALEICESPWLDPAGVTAWAKLCYDAQGLHVRMGAKETHIRAEERGPVGMSCQDSCLEFFFCPDPADARYLNVEYGAGGCLYLGIGLGRADRTRLLPHASLAPTPEIVFTDDGWMVTYTISLSLLHVFFPGLTFTPGTEIRANCYKCGDLTDHPHYLLWNPATSEDPDFHRSCDFGKMRFA